MGWIDAPVSGGTKGAEEATLAIMAGGEAADVERTAGPIFWRWRVTSRIWGRPAPGR